jgi:hypothetical protein
MNRPVQPNTQSSVRPLLFSEKNYNTLQTVLVQEFEQRNNNKLTVVQVERLRKTIDHYCKQVYEVHGEAPVQALNHEVLNACVKDYSQYLQRKDAVRDKNPVKQVMDNTLFQDTSNRFEKISQERNEVKGVIPTIPDFRIPLNEDGPPAAEMYEIAKKKREMEILRAQTNELQRADMGLQGRVRADTLFNEQQDRQNRATELVAAQRPMQSMQSMQSMDTSLVVLPDRRELMKPIEATVPVSNTSVLSQDILISESGTISYREIENNLFIYSGDRDWLRNNKENRYSFTVNFDPASNGQSFGPTLSAQHKFKNIVRIELVKAIMPGESLNISISCRRNSTTNDTTYQDNILNLPYITIRVAELENNNYGTDSYIDRSFGVLQYDAQWISDSNVQSATTRGFLAMIPKFLKCQKEYYPTPLSTLQKLSIDIRRPNGELISTSADTFDIGGIIAPQINETIGPAFPFTNAIKYLDTPLLYNMMIPANSGYPANFFINTTKYFSKFEISSGDRIQISGYTYSDAALNDATYGQSLRDFCAWINRPEGHIVINMAYAISFNKSSDTTNLRDGFNNVGYANFLIIQARYNDPTTGSTELQPFGPDFGATLNAFGVNLQSPVRLMNLNKQLSVVFRIITREMDALPQLRPSNNY